MKVPQQRIALFVLLLAASAAGAAERKPQVPAKVDTKAAPAADELPARWDRLEPRVVERAAQRCVPAVPAFPAERP